MVKTILITGCSTGVGLSSAKLFYEKGWNVAATMRTPKNDTELSKLDASRIICLQLDVKDKASIQKAVEAAVSKFGRIDLLLNNAGRAYNGVFEMINPENIREQFEVNVFGEHRSSIAII